MMLLTVPASVGCVTSKLIAASFNRLRSGSPAGACPAGSANARSASESVCSSRVRSRHRPRCWPPTASTVTDRDSLLRKLHELRSEHRDLDTVIARLADQGAADQLHLQRLKKRKLMLKDEIAWLESRLIPDSIA